MYPGATRSKYGNRKVVADGYTFDSAGEAKRYQVLKLMQHAGEITRLEVHPHWDLAVNGIKIGRGYTADFSYRDKAGELVVEDFKGVRTEAFVLRKKLMKAVHGIDVREVRTPSGELKSSGRARRGRGAGR